MSVTQQDHPALADVLARRAGLATVHLEAVDMYDPARLSMKPPLQTVGDHWSPFDTGH